MSSHTGLRRSPGANLRAGANAAQAHAGVTGAHPPVCSFLPIANRAARVLVLGSMPGAASLVAGQYYAYRHNAFWPIMGELFGAGPQIAYARRTLVLKRAGLALWDVMASCIRVGSLDADIDETSIVPNDFHAFFAAHPRVMHVFFNGVKAEHCFNRYVRPQLPERLTFTRLPSTSPAHAGLSFERKLKAWRAVADALQENEEESAVGAEAPLTSAMQRAGKT